MPNDPQVDPLAVLTHEQRSALFNQCVLQAEAKANQPGLKFLEALALGGPQAAVGPWLEAFMSSPSDDKYRCLALLPADEAAGIRKVWIEDWQDKNRDRHSVD